MKKIFLSLVVAGMVATAGVRAQAKPYPIEGDAVPTFKVEMTDGTSVDIAALKGKVVLINFWATWCPYCVQELEIIGPKVLEPFKGRDFVFLPVSRGEAKATVQQYLKKKGWSFASGLDSKEEIFHLFAEKSIPRNILVDRTGRIAALELGYSPEEFDLFVKKIEKALK